MLAVIQASRFECLSFDALSLFLNGFVTSELDVCGDDIVDAFVVALAVGDTSFRSLASRRRPSSTTEGRNHHIDRTTFLFAD